MIALLIIFIVISFLGGLIFMMVTAVGSGVHAAHQERKLNSNLDETKEIWKSRVEELGIDLEKCIYVLFYTNKEMESGNYEYLWYDGKKVRSFSSPEYIGKSIQVSPKKWKIISYNVADIIDVQRKPNYCMILFSM